MQQGERNNELLTCAFKVAWINTYVCMYVYFSWDSLRTNSLSWAMSNNVGKRCIASVLCGPLCLVIPYCTHTHTKNHLFLNSKTSNATIETRYIYIHWLYINEIANFMYKLPKTSIRIKDDRC